MIISTLRFGEVSFHLTHKIFLKLHLPVPGRPPVKMLLGSITHHLQNIKFGGCSLLTAHCAGESHPFAEMVAKILTLFVILRLPETTTGYVVSICTRTSYYRVTRARILNFYGAQESNRFKGINSASLCS
jgi:hypothetical protein